MEEQIRLVMAQTFGLDVALVPPDASQQTIPAWDSLGHINLVLALEMEFRVQFTTTQIPLLVDMASICDALQHGRSAA